MLNRPPGNVVSELHSRHASLKPVCSPLGSDAKPVAALKTNDGNAVRLEQPYHAIEKFVPAAVLI